MDMISDPVLHQVPLTRPPAIATRWHGFGSSLHRHHPDQPARNGFWVVNLISEGGGVLHILGREFPFSPGCALVVPAGVAHRYAFASPTRKTYAHFHAAPAAGTAPMAVVQDLGPRSQWFRETILEARRVVADEPERATAMLWNLLWALTAGPAGGPLPAPHPVIRGLLDHLAEHLADPLDPGALARRLGVSPTHLNRLCREAFGAPLAAHVRRCRVARAQHLLCDTSRAVAGIAAEVGYPDLQHFNKLLRAATGMAPRELRRRGRPPSP